MNDRLQLISLKLKSSGQSEADSGGQSETDRGDQSGLESGGQSAAESGGQFGRIIQKHQIA